MPFRSICERKRVHLEHSLLRQSEVRSQWENANMNDGTNDTELATIQGTKYNEIFVSKSQ